MNAYILGRRKYCFPVSGVYGYLFYTNERHADAIMLRFFSLNTCTNKRRVSAQAEFYSKNQL